MSDNDRDPKEVEEMRQALIAFRKAARGVKDSQRGMQRVVARPTEVPAEREDDTTTKKLLVPV